MNTVCQIMIDVQCPGKIRKVMYCFMSASIHCGYHVIFNRANYILFPISRMR